jgi:hypothetical protein
MNGITTKRIAAGLVLALAGAPLAVATARESGFQLPPDGRQILVSKDVGAERWVIVQAEDGTVSGNVFRDEGAPLFVWCQPREDAPGGDDTVELSCFGADACPAAPCDESRWDFIADVDLPESFFAPPGTPTPDDSPSPSRTPSSSRTPSPSATPTPDDTPTPGDTPGASRTPTGSSTPVGTSSPEPDGDIRCCVPDDGGPECEDRTPAECAARGGVNLGRVQPRSLLLTRQANAGAQIRSRSGARSCMDP